MSPLWRAAVVAALLAPSVGVACSCVQTTLAEQLDSAEIVALVRIGATRLNSDWLKSVGDEEVDFDVKPILAEFEVLEVYKGDISGVRNLTSGYGGGDCGLPLLPGTDVLIASTPSGENIPYELCSASMALGLRSVAVGWSRPPILHGSVEATLDAVSSYLRSGETIHECVSWADLPWNKSDKDNEMRRKCDEYFSTFETRDLPPNRVESDSDVRSRTR